MIKYSKGQHIEMTAEEVAELEAYRAARAVKERERALNAPITVEEALSVGQKLGRFPSVAEVKAERGGR